MVKYIRTLSRERINEIRSALRSKKSADLWNKWKRAEKYAGVRHRGAGCTAAPVIIYFDVLKVIVWARGGEWYEDESEIPPGDYYNTFDGQYYLKHIGGRPTELYIP